MSGDSFKSPRDRLDFWVFVVVTFLCGLTWSAQTLLAPILNQTLPVASTGTALALAAIPMVFAAVAGTSLIHRFGAKQVATLSMLTIFVGHLSFSLTGTTLVSAGLSRIITALGFGLFVPSTMLFAKARLGTKNPTYLFGIYSSMVIVSFAFGPGIFEIYLHRYGSDSFFLVSSAPVLVALGLAAIVPSRDSALSPGFGSAGEKPPQVFGPKTWPAYTLIFFMTLIYGFTNSFLPVFMIQAGIMVGYFFAPQSAALVLSRLTVLRFMEGYSVWVQMFWSFALLSVSYLIMLARDEWWSFTLGGILCGVGTSIAYPTLSMWLYGQYSQDEQYARTQATGVFNAAYFLGFNVNAFLGGLVIAGFGEHVLIGILIFIGIVLALFTLYIGWRAQRMVGNARQT